MPIPYARVEVENGRTVRVCPVCDERIPEDTDRDGEPVGNPYGEHYEAEHAQTDMS